MKTVCLMAINYAHPNVVEIVDNFKEEVVKYLGTKLVPTNTQEANANMLLVVGTLPEEDKEKLSSLTDSDVIQGLCFFEVDKAAEEDMTEWLTAKYVPNK